MAGHVYELMDFSSATFNQGHFNWSTTKAANFISASNSGSREAHNVCHRTKETGMNFSVEEPVPTLYFPVVAIPILVALCTIGNGLNLWILSWHCPSGLKKALLLALAFSDTIVIWSAVPRYLNNNSEILRIDLASTHWSFLISSYGFFSWTQYTFTYVSDWILLAFSVERLYTFRYKKLHRLHKTSSRTAVCLIVGFVLISGATTAGTLVWYYSWWNHRHDLVYSEPLWITKWSHAQDQIDIVFPIVVAFCLLGVNSWLLTYLKRQIGIGKSLIGKSNGISDQRTSYGTSDNLTRMLLGCVAVYFITQVPAVILNTLNHFSTDRHCFISTDTMQFWQPVVGTVALVNYSVNFFVYLGMSAKFRNNALQLCQHGYAYGTFRALTSSFSNNSSRTTRNSSIFSATWRKDRDRNESRVTLMDEFPPPQYNINPARRAYSLLPRGLPSTMDVGRHRSNTLENYKFIGVPPRKSF